VRRGTSRKELSHNIGISVRILRKIENENAPIPITILEAFSRELKVDKRELIYALDTPQLVADASTESAKSALADFGWDKDQRVPPFDDDLASVTMDESDLIYEASHIHDVDSVVQVALNTETDLYVTHQPVHGAVSPRSKRAV
jgi:transcriptional regulator with XRE-family HTH domain